jgi:hypothetical protein
MNSGDEEDELNWEHIIRDGSIVRRIGRSKVTGLLQIEAVFDEKGREIETRIFDEKGILSKRTVYEYDNQRRPTRILAYDSTGKLIWRQLRGCRPEELT